MYKPHILLLPGMLSDARLWQHQAAALGRAFMRPNQAVRFMQSGLSGWPLRMG